jgi:hypothetical protein
MNTNQQDAEVPRSAGEPPAWTVEAVPGRPQTILPRISFSCEEGRVLAEKINTVCPPEPVDFDGAKLSEGAKANARKCSGTHKEEGENHE